MRRLGNSPREIVFTTTDTRGLQPLTHVRVDSNTEYGLGIMTLSPPPQLPQSVKIAKNAMSKPRILNRDYALQRSTT